MGCRGPSVGLAGIEVCMRYLAVGLRDPSVDLIRAFQPKAGQRRVLGQRRVHLRRQMDLMDRRRALSGRMSALWPTEVLFGLI